MKSLFLYGILMSFIFSSCSKSVTVPTDTAAISTLSVEFDNIVGGQNLQLGTGVYTNANGENFSVDNLSYFISNIVLTKTDGVTYTVPQDSSYFLVSEANLASRFARVKAPVGEYSKLSFVLGVDSLRSASDISKRTGVLDPAGDHSTGMYWGWNSGYIFLKMEGTSPVIPTDAAGTRKFRYHIGGFGGYSAPTLNNIKTITLDLTAGGVARVRPDRNSNVHLMVDVLKIFNGTTNLSLATNSTIMFGDFSTKVANNYSAMFRHDHTEN